MSERATPTQSRVRALFKYEPSTGRLFWREARNGIRADRVAGSSRPTATETARVKIDGVKYARASIIWLYVTGLWPPVLVDHRNRDNGDDRWRNLRLADKSLNATNAVRAKPKRPDLPRGVTEHPGGYLAKISVEGQRRHLGLFQTPEDASEAYLAANAFRSEFLP